MITITQETAEKIRVVWSRLNEDDKGRIKNLITMLYDSINKINNQTMKQVFEQLLSLVETKLLRNPDANSITTNISSINYDKINKINNIIKNTEIIIDPKRINDLINKIITFNTLLKDYMMKKSNDEFLNSNDNIIDLFEFIISDLIKLFDN